MKKSKRFMDERIAKEYNSLSAKMYYVITALTVISLIVKLLCKVPVYVYALEIITLVASTGYALLKELQNGILLVSKKDDALRNIQQEILSKAMMIAFWFMIIGECVFFFAFEEYMVWLISYFCIWMVPALIITICSIKNGWMIWGSKKREQDGMKDFKKRVIIGSLVFGLIMGGSFLFRDGSFQASGILWILGMAAGWGIPFYFIMAAMVKKAEQNANQQLAEKEQAIEE